jgi:hypothetical protein
MKQLERITIEHMRIKHNLWRVKNGWILVPEGDDGIIKSECADEITVFKSLKEFADEFPKRERKRASRATKPKPQPPQPQPAQT